MYVTPHRDAPAPGASELELNQEIIETGSRGISSLWLMTQEPRWHRGFWKRRSKSARIVICLIPVGTLTLCLWVLGLINTSATLLAYATVMLALGTIGLAVGTVLLYLEQRVDLEVAREHVKMAERQLQASIRPWLVVKNRPSIFNDTNAIVIRVTPKNIGNGLAIILPHTSVLGSTTYDSLQVHAEASDPVVPPGEETLIAFDVKTREHSIRPKGFDNWSGSIRLTYADFGGEQITTMLIGIQEVQIAFVKYFEGLDISGEPFVEVRPSGLGQRPWARWPRVAVAKGPGQHAALDR